MPMKLGTERPNLSGATEWINLEGNQEILSELHGSAHPYLVHFWSVSCYLCKDRMPRIQELAHLYKDKGLKIIAIHMPRQEQDTDMELVRSSITSLGIKEPCAIDNSHLLKDAFLNEQGWVPAYYLFDADGKLKARAAGEVGLSIVENALTKLFPTAISTTSDTTAN